MKIIKILSGNVVLLEIDCIEEKYYESIMETVGNIVNDYNKLETQLENKLNIYIQKSIRQKLERTASSIHLGEGTIDLVKNLNKSLGKNIYKHQAFVYPMINESRDFQNLKLVKELSVS